MEEKSNKHSGGWKQLPIETKQAVLNYFAKFDSRDITFYVYKLWKDAEFFHLELARNGFHTVNGRPLTLHPQLKKKIDEELKLQAVSPVSEPKTSLSTQQTPDDKLSLQQTSDSELITEQNLDKPPALPLQKMGKIQTIRPVMWETRKLWSMTEKQRTKKMFQKPLFQNQHQRKKTCKIAVSLSVSFYHS